MKLPVRKVHLTHMLNQIFINHRYKSPLRNKESTPNTIPWGLESSPMTFFLNSTILLKFFVPLRLSSSFYDFPCKWKLSHEGNIFNNFPLPTMRNTLKNLPLCTVVEHASTLMYYCQPLVDHHHMMREIFQHLWHRQCQIPQHLAHRNSLKIMYKA